MPSYPRLARLAAMAKAFDAKAVYQAHVVPYLVQVWLDDYERGTPDSEIVETSVDGFHYLFDVGQQRLIAAWGVSRGRHLGHRDSGRMKGHPQGSGKSYHRGHAIAHSLGGALDINLVTQLGSVNIGPFRALEHRAVATPGSLYFTYWKYSSPDTQTPAGVEQGLLCPGSAPDIRDHRN